MKLWKKIAIGVGILGAYAATAANQGSTTLINPTPTYAPSQTVQHQTVTPVTPKFETKTYTTQRPPEVQETQQTSVYKEISSQCDPNYSDCVPIDSDVDCAGGSGNGPKYVTGPVYVIGSDIYGLDRDHDGVGCE